MSTSAPVFRRYRIISFPTGLRDYSVFGQSVFEERISPQGLFSMGQPTSRYRSFPKTSYDFSQQAELRASSKDVKAENDFLRDKP